MPPEEDHDALGMTLGSGLYILGSELELVERKPTYVIVRTDNKLGM